MIRAGDHEVQPRIVRLNQAYSIYNDLRRNPLHEPPSCRIGENDNGSRPLRGQQRLPKNS